MDDKFRYRYYNNDEVYNIIRRSLKNKPHSSISHDELLKTAKEFGLNEQDIEIEDPAMRPAFISWWDYGFYEVAIGGHPTVADNFQDGIPTAANFHTSTSEREAVAIFSIRLFGHLKRTVYSAEEQHYEKTPGR